MDTRSDETTPVEPVEATDRSGGRPDSTRTARLGLLVMAGEAVFLLPFVLPRVFRPTLLSVLDIDNTMLGAAFSAYGLVAMAAYFFGGPLADRFGAQGADDGPLGDR